MRFSLQGFSSLPGQAARKALLTCCSSTHWAAEAAAGRPFASVDEIPRRSAVALSGLAVADLAEALAGHPAGQARIEVDEYTWELATVAGAGHPHTFIRSGQDMRRDRRAPS